MPSAGTNIIVVTHKPNILDAFGKDLFDVHEGEARCSSLTATALTTIVRIQAGDWSKLAQTAN
jgi:hypothetical protein